MDRIPRGFNVSLTACPNISPTPPPALKPLLLLLLFLLLLFFFVPLLIMASSIFSSGRSYVLPLRADFCC
jgi:hypothetical protein